MQQIKDRSNKVPPVPRIEHIGDKEPNPVWKKKTKSKKTSTRSRFRDSESLWEKIKSFLINK